MFIERRWWAIYHRWWWIQFGWVWLHYKDRLSIRITFFAGRRWTIWRYKIWWNFDFNCVSKYFNIVDDEDNDDDAQPEPENSSLPINIKELSTSQIQTVVTEHFDMNCEKCETKFSGFYEAKSHYQFAHNIARGYVKCCDLKIKEHKDYRSHVLWHLNPIVFEWVCLIGLLMIRTNELIIFITNFSCLICGSSFKTLKSYHAHKHLHKNRALKRFICDICDATFPFKQKLERHIMQVHAAKKKYFCEECGNRLGCYDFYQNISFHTNQFVYSVIIVSELKSNLICIIGTCIRDLIFS